MLRCMYSRSWVTVCGYIVAVPGRSIVMSSGNFVSQLVGLLGARFVDVAPTAFGCTHLTGNVMIIDAFSKMLDQGVLLIGPTDFFYSQTTVSSDGEQHENYIFSIRNPILTCSNADEFNALIDKKTK